MFMKPLKKGDAPRARLQLEKKDSKIIEKVIVTGPFLYQYSPAAKTVYVHNMQKGAAAPESFLSFLFGMGADQARNRFAMKLQEETPHPHFHEIEISPRQDKDKVDFVSAKLWLYRSNNLPAQIWYKQANQNTIVWTFTNIQTNVDIPAKKYFVYEEVPGWRIERDKKAEVGPGPKKIGSK
jgi:TIGR03009 family protein